MKEMFVMDTLQRLQKIRDTDEQSGRIGRDVQGQCANGVDALHGKEPMVYTKYKTVDKKVELAPRPLPANNEQKRKEVSDVREYWTARRTSGRGKAGPKALPKRMAALEE